MGVLRRAIRHFLFLTSCSMLLAQNTVRIRVESNVAYSPAADITRFFQTAG